VNRVPAVVTLTGNFEEVTYEFVKKNVGEVFWVEASIKPPQGHE
jgi:hypothetical protein